MLKDIISGHYWEESFQMLSKIDIRKILGFTIENLLSSWSEFFGVLIKRMRYVTYINEYKILALERSKRTREREGDVLRNLVLGFGVDSDSSREESSAEFLGTLQETFALTFTKRQTPYPNEFLKNNPAPWN